MAQPRKTVAGQSRAEIMSTSRDLRQHILNALAGGAPRKFIPLMRAIGCADRFRMERALNRLILERCVVANRKLGGTTYAIAAQVGGLVALYCPPIQHLPKPDRHVKERHVVAESRRGLPALAGYQSGLARVL